MKTWFRVSTCAACLAWAAIDGRWRAAAAVNSSSAHSAAPAPAVNSASDSLAPTQGEAEAVRLVQQALHAELAGDAAARGRLLEQAGNADAQAAAPHWQRGEVAFDGKWRSLDEAASLAKSDKRRAEYRQRFAAAGDDAVARRDVARWCDDQGLADEAKFLWNALLAADPSNAEARQRLNLRETRRGLLTPEQIVAEKDAAKQREKQLKAATAKVRALLRDAAGNDPQRAAAALDSLRDETTYAELPAVEQAISFDRVDRTGPLSRLPSERRNQLLQDLHVALLSALARMPQHGATVDLANYAILSPSPEVRRRAAEALKLRRPEEYVPLLMSALKAPIETQVDVFTAPDGTVAMTETITEHGPTGDRVQTRDANFNVAGALTRDLVRTNPAAVGANHLARAESLAAATQQNVDRTNAVNAQRNERIIAVLKITLGKDFPQGEQFDVQKWWSDWRQYNELSLADEQPQVAPRQTLEYTTAYLQAPPPPSGNASTDYSQSTPAEPRRTVIGSTTTYSTGGVISSTPIYGTGHSCFVAGTTVWTQTGPAPIEQLRSGDMVLSQHPATGELAYRPVLLTTRGMPGGLMRLRIGDETITATLGHRFWVDGRGWEMAKALTPQMALHGVVGAVDFVSAEPLPKEELVEAFNLIVQDFGTYFVGQSKLLVHDISCPGPTRSAIPGMAPIERLEAMSPDSQLSAAHGDDFLRKSIIATRRAAQEP